jgi:hypothetical protein
MLPELFDAIAMSSHIRASYMLTLHPQGRMGIALPYLGTRANSRGDVSASILCRRVNCVLRLNAARQFVRDAEAT